MAEKHALLETLLSMGFNEAMVTVALADERVTTVDAAISFIMDGPPSVVDVSNAEADTNAEADAAASAVMSCFASDNTLQKLVLVVRQDLGMSPGKVAAQCVHAALGVVQHQTPFLLEWRASGEKTIVLACRGGEEELKTLQVAAERASLPTHRVHDAGRTEVESNTATVLAIGPAVAREIDEITGHLPTF